MKQKITKTNKKVLKMIIKFNQPIKAEDLVENNSINLRTIRYSLKNLCDSNLLQRIPNLEDMRSFHYRPTNKAYALLSSE